MPDKLPSDDIHCEILLNGVPLASVNIRQTAESEGDFDVVVADPIIGSFALHSDFEIDLFDRGSSGRRVSLDELKAILKSRNLLPFDDLPKASEVAEMRLFARVDDIEIPHWEAGRLSVRGREAACARFVERVFYRVGIPHLASGTTFIVPSVSTARIPLKRAGFRRSTISASALLEPRTKVTIQLVERDPDR